MKPFNINAITDEKPFVPQNSNTLWIGHFEIHVSNPKHYVWVTYTSLFVNCVILHLVFWYSCGWLITSGLSETLIKNLDHLNSMPLSTVIVTASVV
jgi:hypothetical protein